MDSISMSFAMEIGWSRSCLVSSVAQLKCCLEAVLHKTTQTQHMIINSCLNVYYYALIKGETPQLFTG